MKSVTAASSQGSRPLVVEEEARGGPEDPPRLDRSEETRGSLGVGGASRLAVLVGIAVLLTIASTSAARAHEPVDREIVDLSERIASSPGRVDLLLERARLWSLERRFDEALADLALADALVPGSALLLRARVYAAAGREREAEALLEVLPESHRTHPVLVFRATLREGSGRLAEALADYERAEEQRITVASALGHGRVLRRLHRSSDAVRVYREALAQLGAAVVVRVALIDTLVDLGRYEEALRAIRDGRAHARLAHRWALREARVLDAMGRSEEAELLRRRTIADLRAHLTRRPTAARWLLLARALEGVGRRAEALEAVDRALVLMPRLSEARALRARLGDGR